MTKRWKWLRIGIAVIIGLLICRTAYIQIAGHPDLSAAAEMQQYITLEGADTRGIIYDRNGTPIAGGNQEYIYIIKKEKYDGETQNALNQLYAEEVPDDNSEYMVFTSQIYSKSIGERLIRNSDVFIMEANRRYERNQAAPHIIGYVNSVDASGVSGLELQYDNVLSAYRKKVTAAADVNGKLLQGYGLAVKSAADEDLSVKEGITTTLDLGLQRKTEEVLKECGYNGAVVICKTDTGEILAAASTPDFETVNIEAYMESDNGELVNKVTQGEYPPGSIFKIVVAAAAIESGIEMDRKFVCTGSETVNGRNVKCNTGGESGHGEISLEEAFAYSCNSAFIQLGQMTGAEAIINMAGTMGLGKTVLEGYPGENDGNLMTTYQTEGAAIANLSIGQGEMLVTPLQVVQMTSIVANNGIKTGMSLIREREQETDDIRCISQETAATLQRMMAAVSEYGTGKDMSGNIKSCTKTGSAESIQSGSKVVHGWFTGYIPAGRPEYAITVFTENGKSGRTSAGPVYKQLAEYIADTGLMEYETGF